MSKLSNLKTIFSSKELDMLKTIRRKTVTKDEGLMNKVVENKCVENSKERISGNVNKNCVNTLRTILDTILMNPIIQKAIGIYDIMSFCKKEGTKKITKKYYSDVLKKIGGDPSNLKLTEIRRTIMMNLPPNPNIENIIDDKYKIKEIKNKKDRDSVIQYLSKN
jgi:hypothetical protein